MDLENLKKLDKYKDENFKIKRTRVNGAYKGFKKFFNYKLIELAIESNYHPSNILILQDKKEELKSKFPDIYNNLLECQEISDDRDIIEYGQDIIANWLFEDYLLKELKKTGLNIIFSGKDKQRIILKKTEVSATCDYLIKYNDYRLNIELMVIFSKYWEINKKIDLRYNKYYSLQKNKALLLGICLFDNKFIMINLEDTTAKKEITKWDKKGCYISIDYNDFKQFSIDNLYKSIIDLIDAKTGV